MKADGVETEKAERKEIPETAVHRPRTVGRLRLQLGLCAQLAGCRFAVVGIGI